MGEVTQNMRKIAVLLVLVCVGATVTLMGAGLFYTWYSPYYEVTDPLTAEATIEGDLSLNHTQTVNVAINNTLDTSVVGNVTVKIVNSTSYVDTLLATSTVTVEPNPVGWSWSGGWTPKAKGSYRVKVTFEEV